MKILLISGHGAGDPGAVSVFGKEADLTIEQVKKIKAALDAYADVSLYPTDRNAYTDIKKGALKVNFKEYDYVLEVHFNSCVNDISGNGKTTGTEIYVTKAETGVGVEAAIVNNIAGLGLTNRGVKRTDFTVIYNAKKAGVSAALVEICFIDDRDDMNIYNAKKDAIAQAVANGVISGFGLKKGGNTQAAAPAAPNGLQKVQTACKNAKEFLEKIAPLCQADYKLHKILPSLSIAQACLESGYGTSDLYVYGSAAFGIKAAAGWKGKVFRKNTREVLGGADVFVDADFRAYANLAESVSDHGEFLQKDIYKKVVGETNFQAAAKAVKAAGYATDPEYVSKLTKIYNEQSLARFDSAVLGASGGQGAAKTDKGGYFIGDVVFIRSGAVYGGLASTRGKAVPAAQCGNKKHTIAAIQENKGVMEAKLKEINSWVALGYLTKTGAAASISVGSVVKIRAGAVYGGLASTRGKAVPAAQCGNKKHTIAAIQENKGVREAKLKEINSWVAVASLEM